MNETVWLKSWLACGVPTKRKLSDARFEREQEAITARLVSVYRAIDRLKVA